MSQVKSEELIPFLRRNSVFSLLDEASVEQLADKMQLLRYSMGDVILQEGDVGSHAFLIYSGRVRIVKQSNSGKIVTLGTQHAGDIFGEQAILKDTKRTASVRAAEDVALFRIEQEDFRQLVDAVPKLASYVEKFMNDSALRDFLRTSTFLEALKPQEITSLLDQLTEKEFAADTTVLNEGDAGDFMYIVRSGQLKVERQSNGSQQFVRYLREGEYFGEWALMTGEARSATVTTLSDTRCFSLSRDHFDALLESAPKLRDQLVERFRRYQIDGKLDRNKSSISESDAFDGEDNTELKKRPIDDPALAKSSETKSEVESTLGNVSETVIPDKYRLSAVESNGWRKQKPDGLLQHTESDCGPTALAMVALVYGVRLSISKLRAIANVARSGVSLFELSKTAESIGFQTHALQTSQLEDVALPAIAHFGGQHYVTVFRVSRSNVLIGDPAQGLVKLDRVEFNASWSGNLLLLRPTAALRETEQQKPIRERLGIVFQEVRFQPRLAMYSALISVGAILGPWSVGRLVEGGFGILECVGIILFVMWPIFSYRRQQVAAESWDRSAFASEQHIQKTLTHVATDSTSSVVNVLRLAHAREKLREAITGPPLAALLNSFIPLAALISIFIINTQLGIIAFIGGYAASGLIDVKTRRNTRHVFTRTTESVRAQVRLLDNAKNDSASVTCESLPEAQNEQYRLARFDEHNLGGLLISLATCGVLLWRGLVLLETPNFGYGELATVGLLFSVRIFTSIPLARATKNWPVFVWYFDQLWYPELVSETETESQADATQQDIERPSLLLENVEHSYGAGSAFALNGISLRIKPGQKVAVVGRSGSGKSTLLKLIRGAITARSGRVLIDGQDIGSVSRSKRHRKFGVANQNDSLICGTIGDNIALFDPQASLDRIKDAALRVNAHEFIESLPLGYQTQVGALGDPLSVSRVQRICLARSVLHAPPIIVWDEATASLDLDTERRLFNKLDPWMADRTFVFATRRLHSIQNADLIIVMSEGSIVEQGTHPDLIEARGLYYYLCCQHA
jgi:ATP-binding cassette subfamily B protein